MPGGVAAIREPWRMGAVWASLATGPDDAVRRARHHGVAESTVSTVLDLAEHPSSPVTTSVGRLFDAIAALIGGRQRISYEAQAAIELEALARTVDRCDAPRYDGCISIDDSGSPVLDPAPLVAAVLADLDAGVDRARVAAGFHEAFGRATVDLAALVASRHNLATVVLTGGVFQNARLTDVVESGLRAEGLEVLVHSAIPPNDGGISIGQAAIAAYSNI